MKESDEKKLWPTIEQINDARKAYAVIEPRDLFYRIARELINLIKENKTSITLPEAIASLLQTWNRAYYRFNRFTDGHFNEIKELLIKRKDLLRTENYEHFTDKDIEDTFLEFENVLGPVGAAKCLHLLVPSFFPIWDRVIAGKYGFPLGIKGSNYIAYRCFLEHTKVQREQLKNQFAGQDILKAIDEYNYVTFSLPEKRKTWEKEARASAGSRGPRVK